MWYYFLFALVSAIVCFIFSYDRDEENEVVSGIVSAVVFLLIFGGCWLCLPNIGLRFGAWFFILLVVSLIGFFVSSCSYASSTGYKAIGIAAFFVVFILVYWSTTSEMLHYEKYRSMLQVVEVDDGQFQKDFVPIKPEDMIKVDEELARKYASAVLEQDAAIGSVCELGNFCRIRLQSDINATLATGETKFLPLANEVVYVAPLEHRSFFKWNKKKTTPGFLIVSAQRQNEVYFVTGVNGEDVQLRYLESACFGDNIMRHIRKAGYINGVDNISFVLDQVGRPFMTATLYRKTIGFAGEVVVGMLTIDVQSGKIKEYDLDEFPLWVDRVYPTELIEKYIDDWGEYPKKHGYWNSVFAQNNVRKMTPGICDLYNGEERYFYTGIQSAGADDGTSGIMMINSKTGEAIVYALQGGANEMSTKQKFNMNYKIDAAEVHASDVIIYPVRGENLYFTTLKGASGDFLGYGVSSVKYRELAAVGKSIDEALLNYYVAKRNGALDSQAIDGDNQVTEIFTVTEKALEDGMYFFRFANIQGKEYMAPSKLSKELKWTKVGDKVRVSFSQSVAEEQTIMIEIFENLSFDF